MAPAIVRGSTGMCGHRIASEPATTATMIMSMAMLRYVQVSWVSCVSRIPKGTWESVTGRNSAKSVAKDKTPRYKCRCRTAEYSPEKGLVGGVIRIERSAGNGL